MAGVLLKDQQRALLQRERVLVNELQGKLALFVEADPTHIKTLQEVLTALEGLFLLVIVGEFNAGKSACINALLRAPVLKEGVIPTTAQITMVRYGDPGEQSRQANSSIPNITYPAEFLRDITIVDTPGVNAILRKHEQLTEEFIPRSDLLLFVASADRPFTESERAFLARMRTWGKKIIIILNKIDLLRTPQALQEVTQFVSESCQNLLGFRPKIFPVSAFDAQQAQTAVGNEAIRLWERSGFSALEYFLFHTLDEGERVRLKLLTPLGVMKRLLAETRNVVEQRASLLEEDARTITTIEKQLQLYHDDMEHQFIFRLTEIENIVLEMRERGEHFCDETIRLKRVLDLMRPETIREAFQEQVIGDSAVRIDGSVQRLIDWMVEQEQRFWQDVMDFLERRKALSARRDNEMIGTVGRQFDYNRRTLLQEVARTASNVLDSYDREAEATQLSQNLRTSIAQAVLVSAGGVGLGALIVAATTVAALDVTGVVAGVVLVGLGFYIIPARRARAKRTFNAKMGELRTRLHTSMNEQFHRELQSSTERVTEAIAPYTRFVRAEQERTNNMLTDIARMENEMQSINDAVKEIDPGKELSLG